MKTQNISLTSLAPAVDRREFLRTGLVGSVALATGAMGAAAPPRGKVDVWVFHGADRKKLMAACLDVISKNGNFGRGVRKLALKVNAAWARGPEVGANTHPDLVGGFLAGCREFGVSEIVLPENTCSRPEQSFKMSGIESAAKQNQARMINLKRETKRFIPESIPKGKRLQRVKVARDFIEADAVVNMPIAKHHGGATVSIAMKNWMGAIEDRRYWHRNDLHQCIADFNTLVKPVWTIVDATHVMKDHGPQGPARHLDHPDLLVLSRDPVAADAWTSMLFVDSPAKVGYIRIAGEMGIGVIDPAAMAVHRIEVPA